MWNDSPRPHGEGVMGPSNWDAWWLVGRVSGEGFQFSFMPLGRTTLETGLLGHSLDQNQGLGRSVDHTIPVKLCGLPIFIEIGFLILGLGPQPFKQPAQWRPTKPSALHTSFCLSKLGVLKFDPLHFIYKTRRIFLVYDSKEVHQWTTWHNFKIKFLDSKIHIKSKYQQGIENQKPSR